MEGINRNAGTSIESGKDRLFNLLIRQRNFAALLCTAATLLLAPPALTASAGTEQTRLEQGKRLAMDRAKGNCLACHRFDDGELPGNLGPPLLAMRARFPDISRLRAQIWDATANNPDSRMPPFGRHGILTDEEIDLITNYLYSL
jgi:sulfur-oxidizing protein SoxX